MRFDAFCAAKVPSTKHSILNMPNVPTARKAPGVLTPLKALIAGSHAARMLHGSYMHWSWKLVVELLIPNARMRPVKPGAYVPPVLRLAVMQGVLTGKLLRYECTIPCGKPMPAAGGCWKGCWPAPGCMCPTAA